MAQHPQAQPPVGAFCPLLDVFSSQCGSSGSTYFLQAPVGIKGSCCLHLPPGYTAHCIDNVFKTSCNRPGESFVGIAQGKCCSAFPQSYAPQPQSQPYLPQPQLPFCVTHVTSTSCKSGAFRRSTSIYGDCCLTPPAGYSYHCVPDVFSSSCGRPGDSFVGVAKGTCCSLTPYSAQPAYAPQPQSQPHLSYPAQPQYPQAQYPQGQYPQAQYSQPQYAQHPLSQPQPCPYHVAPGQPCPVPTVVAQPIQGVPTAVAQPINHAQPIHGVLYPTGGVTNPLRAKCSNTCATANNGVCEDLPGMPCFWGSDCNDCERRTTHT